MVVLTSCENRDRLRRRVDSRDRAIPGWHELTWEHVADFLGRWEPPDDAAIAIVTSNDPNVSAFVDRVTTLGTN